MSGFLNFARSLSIGFLALLAIGILNAVAQETQSEADLHVTFELETAYRKNEHCSEELMQRAIEAIERQRNGPQIYTLGNIASSGKVSANGKKLIEDFIHSQMGSGDPGMRRAAATMVAQVAGERAIPWLFLAVEDPDQDVRIAALSTLQMYASPSDIPALEELIQKRRAASDKGDQDPTVTFGTKTVEILAQLKDGYDDPSRFDDSTFLGIVVLRANRETDRFSDAYILRVIDSLKKSRGIISFSLYNTLDYIAAKKEISSESRKRIARVRAIRQGLRELDGTYEHHYGRDYD